NRFARGFAKRVAARIADCPDAKSKLVFGFGGVIVHSVFINTKYCHFSARLVLASIVKEASPLPLWPAWPGVLWHNSGIIRKSCPILQLRRQSISHRFFV